MKTLLQAINELIDNITVTDRQEANIKQSLSNIEGYLKDKENNLSVERTFTNGSYDRDTNIRPLDDIDMFAVLKFEDWKDEYRNLPDPQSVLSKFKDFLNGLEDYKGKVSQNRPCVTIELSNKSFDILPSFEQAIGGYLIPNYDLKSWTYSYPEQLATNLDSNNKLRKYKVKPTIKAIKYWNRDNNKLIPSYHVEEVAISIFQINDFTNFEESIRLWFSPAIMDTSSLAQAYYTGKSNTAMAAIVSTGEVWQASPSVDTTTLSLWANQLNATTMLMEELIAIDSARALITDSSQLAYWASVHDSVKQVMDSFQQQTMTLKQSVIGNRDSVAAIALNLSSNILDSLPIETNYKSFHNIYLQSAVADITINSDLLTVDELIGTNNGDNANNYGNGTVVEQNSAFTPDQVAGLYSLAFQCPLSGGEAVYFARSMLALVVDTFYSDAALCAQVETRSEKVPEDTVATKIPINVWLFPNPTKDYAILQLSRELDEPLTLKIADASGREIVNEKILTTGSSYIINTSQFGSGMYFVNLYTSDNHDKLFGGKLVVLVK